MLKNFWRRWRKTNIQRARPTMPILQATRCIRCGKVTVAWTDDKNPLCARCE